MFTPEEIRRILSEGGYIKMTRIDEDGHEEAGPMLFLLPHAFTSPSFAATSQMIAPEQLSILDSLMSITNSISEFIKILLLHPIECQKAIRELQRLRAGYVKQIEEIETTLLPPT